MEKETLTTSPSLLVIILNIQSHLKADLELEYIFYRKECC